MYYTYVLLSFKDKKFYIGYTNDIVKRVRNHNKGKVTSTKYRQPLKLIYYEACLNKDDAITREKYLKSGVGKRYIKNRLKKFLDKNLFRG
ncbi:MAG: GIY-YIG nuclease family protein [Patescibacteria group bacterium]